MRKTAILLLVLSSSTAFSCELLDKFSIADAYGSAQLIVQAIATRPSQFAIKPFVGCENSEDCEYDSLEFEVLRTWKGDSDPQIVVKSEWFVGCENLYKINTLYTLYLIESDDGDTYAELIGMRSYAGFGLTVTEEIEALSKLNSK